MLQSLKCLWAWIWGASELPGETIWSFLLGVFPRWWDLKLVKLRDLRAYYRGENSDVGWRIEEITKAFRFEIRQLLFGKSRNEGGRASLRSWGRWRKCQPICSNSWLFYWGFSFEFNNSAQFIYDSLLSCPSGLSRYVHIYGVLISKNAPTTNWNFKNHD